MTLELYPVMRKIAKQRPAASLKVEHSDNIPCDGAKVLPPETMTERVLRESGGQVRMVPEKDFATKPSRPPIKREIAFDPVSASELEMLAGKKGMAMMRGEHVESDPPEKIAAFLEEERKHHIGE